MEVHLYDLAPLPSLARPSLREVPERVRPRPRALLAAALALIAAEALAACGKRHDLSEAQLARVVEANRPSLKACYDAALERNPYKHEIRIAAAIHIEPSGRVSKVELDQEGLPGLGKCLRQAITSWSFPQAEDGTHTSLPIVLQPEVVKKAE